MNIAQWILGVLVGLIYTVFGLNYFFNFLPMPPMGGDAGTFIGILYTSGALMVVKIIEVVGGLLLLTGFRRQLGWTLVLPVSINITLFDLLIAGQPGLGPVLLVLNMVGLGLYWKHAKVLFQKI